MKKFLLSGMFLSLALCSMGAEKKENVSNLDTLVVTTQPVMHCMKCENKIKSNVRFVKGTKTIETSISDQTVTIIYDKRKATVSDFEKEFGRIGYEIQVLSGGK
jgi:copper chaperone CopZ